ncbi:MAG: fumarylacetoacetate hydrolase family protein [Dehalococcoidia bacterium]|nr:fumarylacetoacetate hydrolase family protein [Dehalococcoidia bacterium]
MRIVRFSCSGKVKYGVMEKDLIRGLRGGPFTRLLMDGSTYHLEEVKLLAPCMPSKIVCLGLNYRSHAVETRMSIPRVPLIFLKPSTAVIGPDDQIVLPRESRRVDYEGELGVVICKSARHVSEGKAKEYVLGYTCFNDVSERHNQRDDGQWTRAKGYDTFAPIGPWIETEIEADDLMLQTFLNGQRQQSISTSDLIFGIDRLINFISGVMTLLPGDVIATGTPSGIGPMNPGDTVEVKIDGIGTLKNTVVRE